MVSQDVCQALGQGLLLADVCIRGGARLELLSLLHPQCSISQGPSSYPWILPACPFEVLDYYPAVCFYQMSPFVSIIEIKTLKTNAKQFIH